MLKEIPLTALGAASKIIEGFRTLNTDSLPEYTRSTRVEPIVLLDDALRSQPYTEDLLQTLTSIFSGYYLRAIAISGNVGRIDTIKLLDKLSTNRSPLDSALSTGAASLEDYTHQLPDYSKNLGVSLEARDTKTSRGIGKDGIRNLNEVTNLAVGKMLEVEITDGDHSATIPVNVRLSVMAISGSNLTHILTTDTKDNSASARYHEWRAGQIEFMRDLILCQDIIDAHRKNLIEDTSGIYTNMITKRGKNRLSAVVSGSPSVNTASSMAVITDKTATSIEREIGGKLKQFRKREKLMESAGLMLLVVVDTEWEQVIIYHRSIDEATELSTKALKSANKGSGPDVSDILNAYKLGNSPSL